MRQQGFIIFCLAVVHPFICYGEVNTTRDTILEYLNMDSENVMGHELVHIDLSEHMQKRSFGDNRDPRATRMRFRAFGGNINLWLHPRDSLFASSETPVYFAYENVRVNGQVSYVLERYAMEKVGRLYEDPNHYASVVIGSELTITANMRFRNEALVIRPLPEEVVEEHLRNRRSISGNNVDSSFNSARHVVLKVKDYFPINNIGEGHKRVNVRANSAVPSRSIVRNVDYSGSIYPKILVELDSTYWNQISLRNQTRDARMVKLLEYVLAFWNGVDLSYRHLENPNFRFHIGAIAIAMSPGATPYIMTSKISRNGTFDPDKAVNNAAHFFYAVANQIPFNIYDIAVTMTQLNLRSPAIGIARVDAVCKDPIERRTKDGVALVHDDSAFGGIDTAVHEVGHSFGLAHDDGEKNPVCDNTSGFIMGSKTHPTENTSMFSRCSLAQFNEILARGKLECLYEPPQKKFQNLPKPLPGKILNLDQQCQAVNYQKACAWNMTQPCVQISCTTKIERDSLGVTEYCQPLTHGAAPGTPCGNENDRNPRFCLQNRCVSFN